MPDKKQDFIRFQLFSSLEEATPDAKAHWGKMSAQQMIEHLGDFFDISSGKLKFDLITPAEQLPKYREFLLSDKAFRENTKAPASIIGDEPLPLRKASIEEASAALKQSVESFFIYYENGNATPTVHPVFGPLSFEDWILLHYKHVAHHLRQFGLKSYI